jgi:hypothetical protein
MVRFQLPNAYLTGIQKLLTLQIGQVESIVQFLHNVKVGTGPQSFANQYEATFRGQEAFSRQLGGIIYGLSSFRLNQRERLSDQEIADGLIESLKNQAPETTENDQNKLSEYLLRIFSASNALKITFKAFSLLSENESVFRENHIITDIRLLFKDDIVDSARHGLIIHQLKINAEENGQQTDYYFSLTSTDLQKLKDQITRAIEKEKMLLEDYRNISFITITE